MKLTKYETLWELNEALTILAKANIPVKKVKLLTEGVNNTAAYYILTDESNLYQQGKTE